MSRLVSFVTSLCFTAATLAATACNPSRPTPGDGDAGPADVPDTGVPDGIDAGPDGPPPPPAPGMAMETVVGAGHATSATMTIDIQLGGGSPGTASTLTETARSAPALP